ncbi:hypothetical protein [Photobacterium phosphoreum]|nr:hypothetical protein [Photobacterium phosphoreum]
MKSGNIQQQDPVEQQQNPVEQQQNPEDTATESRRYSNKIP